MKIVLDSLCISTLAVVMACGSHSEAVDGSVDAAPELDGSNPPRLLCDGSDSLRLLAASVPAVSRIQAGQRVLFDNGSFIAIDGHCRFWVKPAASQFEEVRTGLLEASALAEFVVDFRYELWAGLDGVYPSASVISDADDILFLDSYTRIKCEGNCPGESTPGDIVAMRNANADWNARLWAAGESLAGDVRISAVESAVAPEYLRAAWVSSPWPASVPIESIAVSELDGTAEALGFGDGSLLTGADAEALRAMRAAFLRSGAPSRGILSILIRDGDGPVYFVHVRDTIPFEDERGLIPLLHRWPG